MPEQIIEKRCMGPCGQVLPTTEFYPAKKALMRVCKACHLLRTTKNRQSKPKEVRSAINRRNRVNNLENRKKAEKKWYETRKAEGFFADPARHAVRLSTHRRHRQGLKASVFDAYGGFCACCGEDDLRLLTLDHLRNDGAAERRAMGRGASQQIYAKLKKDGYPSGYQVLCFTCNTGRHIAGGVECPHQIKARELWSEFLEYATARAVA